MSTDNPFHPGYVASLLDCQRKLVETLNTAMNRLGELDDPQAARAARAGRDAALACVQYGACKPENTDV